MQQIDDTLYDAFGQRLVSTMFTQSNQYHVVLEVAKDFRNDPTRSWRYLRPLRQWQEVPLEFLYEL